MRKSIGISMLIIVGLMLLNVGLVSAQGSTAIGGTVIDAVTNEPIEGVVVQVDGIDPVLSASTDALGMYSIADVPVGTQTVTASFAGYDSQTAATEVLDAVEVTVNISLQPSAPATTTIGGTVTDIDTGEPIQGALVQVDGSDPVLSASTDASGVYSIADVPVGEQTVTASVDGYDSQTAATELFESIEAIVDFDLQPSLQVFTTISGTVTDAISGEPIEGVVVQVDGTDPALKEMTDASGGYAIAGVLVGDQTFTASVDGYDSETVGKELVADVEATVDFSLQPSEDEDEAEEKEVEEKEGRVAGSRKGYVGTVASITDASGTDPGSFIIKTKNREVTILIPSGGLESITKFPGQDSRSLEDGANVAVLVEFLDKGGSELIQEAQQIIVKPTPKAPIVGAVVKITTNDKGVRILSIMRPNGKVKEIRLGGGGHLPEVGDVVTAFEGRDRDTDGAEKNEPPIVKGLVRAGDVRQRLEKFLDDLNDEEGEQTPEAAERHERRVAEVAKKLEKHSSKQLELVQGASKNKNLTREAAREMKDGLERAESGRDQGAAKATAAKAKAKENRAKRERQSRPDNQSRPESRPDNQSRPESRPDNQ
ncbi:MAG: carboxypeptidase regulatory-like domain-containing protein, partial [SAR202 cluster bacterium]|nr:carboxypeptidase regulatory-like domain-containing protein [SAR202 cluster bacterium]